MRRTFLIVLWKRKMSLVVFLRVIAELNMVLHRFHSEQKKISETSRLSLIFNKLCQHQLTREHFRDFLSTIFDLNDEAIIERLFVLIGQGDKTFSLKQFQYAMHLFLDASFEEQLKFVFRIYDVSADGNLQREELFTFLRKDLPMGNDKEDADMILQEFITLVFKKFDKDQDGLISFDDYSRTCQENPTLIQCFGQVLPRVFRKDVVKSMLNGNLSILSRRDSK